MPNNPGIDLTPANRKKLVRAREAAGWTQHDLAGEVGVGVWTISRIETGADRPSLATLEAICGALGLTVTVNTTVRITKR